MRMSKEGLFKSWDGVELFYRKWEPIRASSEKRAVILIHRGHEHSGRVQEILDGLGLDDYHAFAFDARGHGRSPGPRGYAREFNDLVKDLDHFVKLMARTHDIPMENITLVANSVGAVIASTWVHDYAPRIRSMVLAAPALRVKLYVPFALPSLRLLEMVKHPSFISSYVKGRMLTHDAEEARRYNEDPLVTRDIAVNILLGLHDAATRLIANAGAIVTPTLILAAGKDYVVQLSAQKTFYERLGSQVKEMKIFQDFFHGVFYEKGKEEAVAEAKRFILKTYENRVERGFLYRADRESPSQNLYQSLMQPASPLMDLFFAIQRKFLSTIGMLSEGVRLGFETGFDSGRSLDHVYRNVPTGRTWLGRLIDRVYLNAVGWKGIRIRKIHMEKSLETAISDLLAQNKPVRIVDVAGGVGRYLLDIADRYRDRDMTITIRDNTPGNLEEGRRVAAEMGLANVVRYEEADSFLDTLEIAKPNIIIMSGFLELFPSNALICRAIDLASKAAQPGCYMIYTGQPWHPQQEMIARVLPNREGKPWVMRARSQAEIDELFRAYGFEKLSMQIDGFGIFTVSLAQKKAQAVSASATLPKSAPNAIQDGQHRPEQPQA
ncbi:MAG TPA: bifunctional alpha/beta hydrolase/class I SAM-dependent methyltransferase [Bdellovibrionota bacterium]|nr:bifunctional alpha/beta hydrolase/class I SAM-dependent methyltransferase [Bdellovibrionota bacterium]